jgi:hypothetical protein
MRLRPCWRCEAIIQEATIRTMYITPIARNLDRRRHREAAKPLWRSRASIRGWNLDWSRLSLARHRNDARERPAGFHIIPHPVPCRRENASARPPKRQFPRFWGAAIFAIAMGAAMTGANAQQALGWLELKPLPGRNMVQITGHALALEKAAGLEFTMSVAREGGGSKSVSRQGGRIDLDAGAEKTLSSTSINIEPGGDLTITLKILNRGQEVFSTVMSAKPPDKQSL